MAATELFTNNPSTTVSSGGTGAPSSGTTETWTVASSAPFPAASSAGGGTQFHVSDPAQPSELIAVTNILGTTWTVTRGAESTTPVAHIGGFTVYLVISAGYLTGLQANRVDWLNVVKGYGADPTGVADSTAAIAAAVAAAQAVAGVVYFPSGHYMITSNPFAAGSGGSYNILGCGAAASVIQPSASFTDPTAMDLNFTAGSPSQTVRNIRIDLTNKKTLNGIRIACTTGQVSRSIIDNVRVNYGADSLIIDGGAVGVEVSNFYPQNMTGSGIHITNTNSGNAPSGELRNLGIANTDSSVTTTQGVLIDCFMTGLAMSNVRVTATGTLVFNGGIVYNSASAPTGTNGAFIQAVNCITDGITGPGLALTNCRQFQSSNNFWSCLASTANYGVSISGGQYFRFVNDEISGCGVSYASAPDDIAFTTCEFPYTGTVPGVHKMPVSNPPTHLQIDPQSLSGKNGTGYQLTDNLATFYTALTNPAQIGATQVQLTSGPIFETIPASKVNTNNTALTAGSVFMHRVWLPNGLPVTNVTWCSGSTPLTAGTSIHYWAAVYSASGGIAAGAPLAQSTDSTSPTIAASTIQVMPLSAPYVTTASGYYYLSLFLNQTGGTVPTVMNYAGISALNNISPRFSYVAATAYNSGTAPTSPGAAASLANQFWMGVS